MYAFLNLIPRWLWLLLFFGSVWLMYKLYQVGHPEFIPLLVPGLALPLARALIEAPGAVHRHLKEARYAEWNGRHFVFENVQIRIFWDAQTIWLSAEDIFAVLDQQPDTVARRKLAARLGAEHFSEPPGVDGACFSEQGLARYLRGLPVTQTARFSRWLDREVLPNIRRLREIGSGHYAEHALDGPAPRSSTGSPDRVPEAFRHAVKPPADAL